MSSHSETETYFTNKANSLLSSLPCFVKQYIRSIHTRTSPRTRYEYLKDIDTFFSYLKSQLKTETIDLGILSSLNKSDFEDYFEHMEQYSNGKKTVRNGRASIKRKMSSLRHFFAYLFRNEMIKSDEIRKLAMPKLHKKEIIRLDDDDATNFIDAVENGTALTKKEQDYFELQSVRDKAIVYLLLSTGMRVSECAELDINDVDLPKRSVHIVRKGGDEAIVYFSDEAAGHIEQWLEQRKEDKSIPETETALFTSSRRTRLSVRGIEKLVKKYAARSVPLKHITPHKLRATYATNLYNATGDIYLVAETLGHKDVKTTKEHYANMSDKRKEENRNKVVFKKK